MLRRSAISFLLLVLALSGEARTRPHYGGTLRVEIEGDAWQRPGGPARRLVLEGLTRMDVSGALLPALALDWKTESNNQRWLFRLRPGVHFSDGAPLTPAVVVGSLSASCAAACPWTAVRAVGASVVFTSDVPLPVLPALLAGDNFLISGTGTGPAGALTGTGAFQAAGFSNGVLKLAANENCWQGRPFVDAIELKVHRSIRDQWLDLGVGRADVVEVPAEQMRQAQQDHFRVLASEPVSLLALEIADAGALSNRLLRASLALAIDRGALSNVIFQKQGEVTASLLPASVSGYSFLFPVARDLNRAHELRGGLTPRALTLGSESGPTMQLAAQRIALNLREAGYTIQTTTEGRSDLMLRTLPLGTRDPQTALTSLMRAAGDASAVSDASPARLYQVEREFLERRTLIPLLYLPRAYAVSSRVSNLRLGVDGSPEFSDTSLGIAP